MTKSASTRVRFTRWPRSKRARSGTNASRDEDAAVGEVRGDVREAAHLLLLRQQSEERVEDEVDERVAAFDADVGEVAHRDRDRSPPGFARRRATIASEASIPCTSTPRAASGSAIRPVPIASSSTGPPAGQLGEGAPRPRPFRATPANHSS